MWYPSGPQADQALELSCEEKTDIAEALKDTPVVWNHTGTMDHVTSGKGFNQLGQENPKAGSLGTVTEAWIDEDGTGRAIMSVAPRMAAFLGTGVAPAVSLSHGTSKDGRAIPVELSIVGKPARPGANVEAILDTPTARSDYIERCRQSAKLRTTTMATTADSAAMNTEQDVPAAAAPAVSLVEQGVSAIRSAKQREAVERRMEEMATCAAEANKSLEDLKAELARYKQQAATDGETTKEAVQMWVDSLGPDIAKRWHVDTFGDFSEPNWPQNFVRSMVMASHEKFNQMNAEAAERPLKRQRDEEPAPAPAAAAAAPATQPNPLRAALASTFHVGRVAL